MDGLGGGVGGSALGLLLLNGYGGEGRVLLYNLDMGLTDQSACMEYARLLRESGYAYPGVSGRNPPLNGRILNESKRIVASRRFLG